MFFSRQLKTMLEYIRNCFFVKEGVGPPEKEVDLLEEVEQALWEWQIAINNYNFVADSDLVDLNLSLIDAAGKKYMFLLNKARKEQLVNNSLQKAVCG